MVTVQLHHHRHSRERQYFIYIFATVTVVAATLCGCVALADQSACEKKILKDYPEAECSLEKDKDACR